MGRREEAFYNNAELDFSVRNLRFIANKTQQSEAFIAPAIGEISVEDNAVPTAIAIIGTYVQVNVFGVNGLSRNTTPDAANNRIEIEVTGIYFVAVSAAILSVAGGGGTFEAEVKLNGGTIDAPNVHFDRDLAGGGGDVGSTSQSGLLALSVGDTVELWVRNKTTTENLIFEDVTLTVMQIPGLV